MAHAPPATVMRGASQPICELGIHDMCTNNLRRLFGPCFILMFILLSGSSTNGQLISEPSNVRNVLGCIGCRATVEAFRFIYGRNRTRDAIINIASYICEHFVQRETVVCYGMATQFREEILYVVDKLLLQPDRLCGLFIEDCGKSFNPFSKWNVTIPPKRAGVEYPTYPAMRKGNLRVLQISDLHIDKNYTPGAVANCDSPLCCQPDSATNGTAKKVAGYWGTQAACDVPHWTIEHMFRNINRTQKFDYMLLSGDYMSHLDWAYTKQGHLEVITNLTSMLDHYFPGTPVFWTLGNHEGVPVNSFAPHSIPEKFQPRWLYNQLKESQRRWISQEALQTIAYRGSFTVQLFEGLRLISLNTGYCETTNFWLYLNETDPDGTLSWLVGELYQAENEKQYVHILSHIPPGNSECLEGWASNYYKIVNRFSNTIKAQFFGHIHIDSFTVFYEDMNDDASMPTNVLFSSPSVTTFSGLNPAYRTYEIEAGLQYRVIDYTTYFLNLSKANLERDPEWELLYSAKAEYNLPDLSPSSINQLIDRIDLEPKIYETFLKNSVRRDDYLCEGKCRFELLCQLRRGHRNATLCSHIGQQRISFSKYPLHRQVRLRAEQLKSRRNSAKRFSNDTKKKLFAILRGS
uniref:Sphingomyelin phosphodiesterase n=1 Tax=Ascaris lumbricoides TaxID=6252 RepID=A0A9J2P5J3_ASCLU